jgi:hypothetical protein
MARVWELIAKRAAGDPSLPASVIFLVEVGDSLDFPGWRWAPKTLMVAHTEDSVIDFSMATSRFNVTGPNKLGVVLLNDEEDTDRDPSQVPSCSGFKVHFPGFILKPSFRCSVIHEYYPWDGTTNPIEDKIIIRNEVTREFMSVADLKRSRIVDTSSKEALKQHDLREPRPLGNEIHAGNCAIIYDPAMAAGDAVMYGLLVRISERITGKSTILKVRKVRPVVLGKLKPAAQLVAERLDGLATQAAGERFTKDLVDIKDRQSVDYAAAVERAQKGLQAMVAKVWEEDCVFKKALRLSRRQHDSSGSTEWASIPTNYSHRIDYEQLQDDQAWIID